MLELIHNGGLVMWPLIACSIIVLTIIIERTLFWLGMARRRNRALRDEVLTIAEAMDWEKIEEKTKGSDDAVVRVLKIGVLHRDYDMSKAMEAEAQHLLKKMSQFMIVLDAYFEGIMSRRPGFGWGRILIEDGYMSRGRCIGLGMC